MRNIKPGSLIGSVSPPPSKSITHRAYILAGFSEAGTRIRNLLNSADTNATRDAVERMGAEFKEIENGLQVVYPVDRGASILNCANSGTTLRLMTAMSAIFEEETTLFGDDSLNNRPMGPLISALNQLGAQIDTVDNHAPLTIKAPIRNFYTTCSIAGNVSSQFISGLLLMSAIRGEEIETEINLEPPVISKPYLKLTEELLRFSGIEYERTESSYRLSSRTNFDRFSLDVPSDYSSAAFFLGAAALPGNNITVEHMSDQFTQADSAILDILKLAGAEIVREEDRIQVHSEGLHGFKADIGDSPDLFPILSVIAALADGETVLSGAEHLKFKETDRISAMEAVLHANGIEFLAQDDGAVITGGNPTGGISVDSRHDHRIAMAAAILGTRCKQPLRISNANAVSVSYPTFYEDLDRLSTQ